MDKVEHHGTGDLDLHRPNGAVWPGSPIPAARPALVWAIPAVARRYSPSTSGPSSILTANLLAPFALQTAFPPSDYYEASAPPDGHQPTTSLPATALAGQQEGRPRVVPTFTTNRSTREMPSYTPAASPQVRRSLSSWPPHRFVHPGSGVARHVFIADAHGAPTQIHQVRVGSTLTGLHALVPLVHLLVSLAGPAPSGSADAPRRCQDCFLPSPASPGSGCPQLQPGCCDSPAARAFHPYSVTRRLVAHEQVIEPAARIGRRFDDLFNLVCDPATLMMAFVRVAGNQGAMTAGVDGWTVATVTGDLGVAGFLDDLRAQLKTGTFWPLPARQRMIPKPGGSGKLRKLGIPTIADRVVQAALKLVLEPIFEAGF